MTSGHDTDILLSPLSSLGPLHLNHRRFVMSGSRGSRLRTTCARLAVRVCQLSVARYVLVPLCPCPVPVPLCPCPVAVPPPPPPWPIMSLSRYVHVPLHFVYLVPLCPCLVLPHFRFVPVPLPVLTHFCFAPAAFCLSPIAILVSVPLCFCLVLFQSYGEFCPSHMASFVLVTWRVLSQSHDGFCPTHMASFVPVPFCPNPGVPLSRFVPVLLLAPVLFCSFSGRGLARLC